MNRNVLNAVLFATASLAACAPRPAPPQPPAPAPVRPAPAPAPSPPAPPPAADWRDAPLSPGDWTWAAEGAASLAAFGTAGVPAFMLRCDAPGRISLVRTGAPGGSTITVRTSSNERRLAAAARGGDVVATLAASDPLLDQIAFSRGRILVETEGAPPLILPAWPEPARVTEDCRS
jgi:hypothetical protein